MKVLFIGMAFFLVLAQLYYNAKKRWFNEKLENAFKETLLQQSRKDSFEGTFFATTGRKSQTEKLPDSVYIEDESGKHAYYLDKEKSRKNITTEPLLRFYHTVYFSKHPLVVDSLYCLWQQQIKRKKLEGTFALQIFISDKNEKIKSSMTPHNASLKDFTLCFDLTMGYYCEVEIRGFFKTPWYNLMSITTLMYGFIYWLFIITIYIILLKTKKNMNMVVSMSRNIYKLGPKVIFDADQRKLIINKEEISIKPQTSVLLKHFLDAPEHILMDDEIRKFFWADKSYNVARLHSAITRLRNIFENISSIVILRFENKGYQLQIRKSSL